MCCKQDIIDDDRGIIWIKICLMNQSTDGWIGLLCKSKIINKKKQEEKNTGIMVSKIYGEEEKKFAEMNE